ncbi:MAG: heavy metal sensor histidine kinase [Rhizobacter sp.]
MRARGSWDPRRWSLTLRLTLFFSLAMATVLLVVAWLLYGQLTRQLHERDEAELAHATWMELGAAKALQADKGPDAWPQAWTEHPARADTIGLRVIAPDGRVRSESAGMLIPSDAFPAPTPKLRFRRWQSPTGSARYLLTTVQMVAGPDRIWTLQAAADLSESNQLLDAYLRHLIAVLVVATVASATMAWWLVRRGLAPLRAMNAAIGRIDAHKLDARIGQQPWPTDLQLLAQNFDAMLHRLQASFEQLSRFSSDLAHEFRSPITNLVAAASVMLARERTAPEYQETLAVMIEEGERLARMVSSMLFLARADNAKQALHLEAVSLEAEFTKLTEAFDVLADERGVALRWDGDSVVMADPMLLRRALSNLLSNALQHTPRGGQVELRAGKTPAGIEISVRDSGSGIAATDLPHIFDRFYRADAARSSSESTGLGLAVVRSIAELHSGTVRVESALGRGACFTLLLPEAST